MEYNLLTARTHEFINNKINACPNNEERKKLLSDFALALNNSDRELAQLEKYDKLPIEKRRRFYLGYIIKKIPIFTVEEKLELYRINGFNV